jgi:hypothetical protein
MTPREVATLLNVSQGQIVRALADTTNAPTVSFVLVSRYNLECWKREMRTAEMYLRRLNTMEGSF